MDVLVVGGGGREHALSWKLEQEVSNLYVAPGNAGTESIAQNISIEATDTPSLVKFAKQNKTDLVVIGPDDALAQGLVDKLEEAGIAAFGPSQAAAQIEASKSYSKNLMKTAGIPTADFQVFSNPDDALSYLQSSSYPLMVKVSGLALGKGVIKCNDAAEAADAIHKMMVDKSFGDAGNSIVIESYLDGPEVSLHAFCDGESYAMMPAAQDHKTIFEGDIGPMTGGMGTVAPLPKISDEQVKELGKQTISPLLKNIGERGVKFGGLIYPGLKLDPKRGPQVLEYNARFGDPETQVYMRLMQSSLIEMIQACEEGNLKHVRALWNNQFAVCVVLASAGYPESSTKGVVIEGLEEAEKEADITIFHAGTRKERGHIVTNGGRILGVTAVGDSIQAARDKAYGAIDAHIYFDGMQLREDIGEKALSTTL